MGCCQNVSIKIKKNNQNRIDYVEEKKKQI